MLDSVWIYEQPLDLFEIAALKDCMIFLTKTKRNQNDQEDGENRMSKFSKNNTLNFFDKKI